MARLEDHTFDSAEDALKNAKKLLESGEITQANFDKLKKKLSMKGPAGDLDRWLDKTYTRRRNS